MISELAIFNSAVPQKKLEEKRSNVFKIYSILFVES